MRYVVYKLFFQDLHDPGNPDKDRGTEDRIMPIPDDVEDNGDSFMNPLYEYVMDHDEELDPRHGLTSWEYEVVNEPPADVIEGEIKRLQDKTTETMHRIGELYDLYEEYHGPGVDG